LKYKKCTKILRKKINNNKDQIEKIIYHKLGLNDEIGKKKLLQKNQKQN
jgi:hypothetical protein